MYTDQSLILGVLSKYHRDLPLVQMILSVKPFLQGTHHSSTASSPLDPWHYSLFYQGQSQH